MHSHIRISPAAAAAGILLALLASTGAHAQHTEDRAWWNCPALPDDLVGVAVVSEDWDGGRWYEDPVERDSDGPGPLWRSCAAPLDPPADIPAITTPDDSPAITTPDDEEPVRWRGWTFTGTWCDEVSWDSGVGEWRDPVTAVLYTEGAWDLCAFDTWTQHLSGERSCQDMGWRAPRAVGFMDPDDARVSYLQFPDGAEYSLICVTPRDPEEATPWAAYLLPGLAGGAPPMMMGGGVD